MCGRFTLRTPASLLASWFRDVDFPVIVPRYNIAPTQQILALRQDEGGGQEAVMLRWGLIPSWAKDIKIGNQMINARSETAASKPAFRRAFKSRRCLILADGFFEWKAMAGGKQPFLIQPAISERPLFCFAGLWESWRAPAQSADEAPLNVKSKQQQDLFENDGVSIEHPSSSTGMRLIESCTILTTSANDFMSPLHDRMPVILDEQSRPIWLDLEFQDPNRLNEILCPCPNDWLRIHPVSKLVNKPSIDDAVCIEPVEIAQDK